MECVIGNGIQALCNVLQNQSDATLLLAVMDAFESSWTPTTKRNYQVMMDECGGSDHLEELRQHPNNDVFEKKQATSLSSTLEARDDEPEPCSRNRGNTFSILRKSSPTEQLFSSQFHFGGTSFTLYRKYKAKTKLTGVCIPSRF
jgi:hypothetical protein